MVKQLVFGEDARIRLKRGMDKLAMAVATTLGPKGRNIALDKKWGAPTITHDGVSVAKEIELADPFENMGAQLLKEAATRTNDIAGDGTTTATVLAHAIITEGLKNVAAGANPMQIKRGIEAATDAVIGAIRQQAVAIDTQEEIANVASVSAQDHEIGELIAEVMMNVGTPDRAFNFQALPNHGVGLARLEFIINRMIGVHPKALLFYKNQPDDIKQQIDERIAGYADPVSFFIEKLTEGIATLAAAFWPKPVIVRLSDFKSNEYANLLGGRQYEPHEENPMIGFRGASRYVDPAFQDCFELECFALKKVRDEMGLTNVAVMVPFVRTPHEAHDVINLMHDNELTRGVNGLKVYMMCEIPSNALLADQFLKYFDGFSIGSNDLTQLTLGLDRDSELVAGLFDERNEAVKKLLSMAIQACRKQGKYIGICGQGPSDHPDLARWLMQEGIESVSLNPDSVIDTWLYLAEDNP